MENAPTNEQTQASSPEATPPRCLSRIERRVVGVLVEKAKTTPEAYPLSLNGLKNGCNQKSNRFPQMQLEEDHIEQALDKLRSQGIVGEVQSGGRVPKFRHYMKDWLGVDGTELAVMAELLLRGAQTIGELRGRAARMAKILDISALGILLESLQQKKLVIFLTSPGRGQVVTHTLYNEAELAKVRGQYDSTDSSFVSSSPTSSSTSAISTASTPVPQNNNSAEIESLRSEVSQLREELARLRKDLDDLLAELR